MPTTAKKETRYPGWLTLAAAADYCGLAERVFRRLVDAGIFTRGRFSAAAKRPPIHLKVSELDAWKRAGVDGVKAVRKSARRGK